jgi:23S rRNA pseudouridine2457 synthase
MTAAVGFPTLPLVRVRIGTIKLGELGIGDVLEVKKIT